MEGTLRTRAKEKESGKETAGKGRAKERQKEKEKVKEERDTAGASMDTVIIVRDLVTRKPHAIG